MLKTLGRETKGFRLVSVLTPIFMIAEVIMEMIIPKLMASIIDNGVTPGNMQVIYTVGAQMVVAALFGLLFGILGALATAFVLNRTGLSGWFANPPWVFMALIVIYVCLLLPFGMVL